MRHRLIVAASKEGSITLLEARAAAKAVKLARLSRATKSGTKWSVSDSAFKRYLGHFGVGRVETGTKNALDVKSPATSKVEAGGPKARRRGPRS